MFIKMGMNLIFVFLVFRMITGVRGLNERMNIIEDCRDRTLTLSNSSISVSFLKSQQNCWMKIQAPETHLIYVRIVENDTETEEKLFETEIDDVLLDKTTNKCPIDIFTQETQSTPSYTADPCSDELSEGGLFGNQIELRYTAAPPMSKQWHLTITAVGTGEFCVTSGQFSCLQSGWTPLLCVSKELLCDGTVNCPTGELLSDENPQLCNNKQNNWEKLAKDFLKKMTGKSKTGGSLLPAIQKGKNNFIIQSTTQQPSGNSSTTDLNNISEYGPWGYLMLGMLICGTVLTFCGLWECCCRKTKPPQTRTDDENTPSSVVITSGGNSTAILTTAASGPPKYDDLEQPPSYSVLFPPRKVF